MHIWRIISKRRSATPFDGIGASRVGGRWNNIGVHAVYTSEHLPTAVLELLAHADASDLVGEYVQIEAEIPDKAIEHVAATHLPDGWQSLPAPLTSQTFGDAWLARRSHLAMAVPSAIVPGYLNIILNPLHPDMTTLRELQRAPFVFDDRLIKTAAAETQERKSKRKSSKGTKP